MPEEQMLLAETSKANIINTTANGKIGKHIVVNVRVNRRMTYEK